MLILTWGVDILFVNTRNMATNLTYTLCTMPLGLGISCKACLLFNIFSGDAFVIELCQICQSDYWQKCNLKGHPWRVNGDLGSQFGLGASEQTRGGRKLCILFCHGYWTWRNKEVGGLKSLYERDGGKPQRRGQFLQGELTP